MTQFHGAMTALITPFKGGKVDFDAMSKLIEFQIESGIQGLVMVGTTGESATLTVDEHLQVISHACKVVSSRIPVVAGAGANSTNEALHLSEQATKAGADALLHVCPYYNRPSQEGLYRHFKLIADTAKLPVILYNVPHRTGSDLAFETTVRLSKHKNIVALKDATGDMRRGSRIIDACGSDLALLSGDDFTTFDLMALGGKGVVSVVSNVTPKKMTDMCNALLENDIKKALPHHRAMMPLCELLFEEPNPAPCKAAMALLEYCTPEIRLPLVEASEGLVAKIKSQITHIGR